MLACAGPTIVAHLCLLECQWLLLSGWAIAYIFILIMGHHIKAINVWNTEIT